MNEFVLGKNVQLVILTEEVGPVIVEHNIICAKSCTITKEWEMIPATTVSSGLAREFKKRRYSWTMSVEGISTTDTILGTDYTVFDLMDEADAVELQMTFTDQNALPRVLTGFANIVSVDASGDVSDFSSYTIEFQGTGVLYIT